MKQNGLFCKPAPALLFFLFRFEYLISGPKSYRDFGETSPWHFMMELNIVLMPQDTHSDIKISNSTTFFFFIKITYFIHFETQLITRRNT